MDNIISSENVIYEKLQKSYFHSAANLIIESFQFPKIIPKKIIYFLFIRDFNKRINDVNYVDICATKNNKVIGIMRAKYKKNIWLVNTNCVDKNYSNELSLLWIKIMLFLASEVLKKCNTTTVSFTTSQPAIARIGAKYASKHGLLVRPIINFKNTGNSKHFYEISKK